jgi:hypothetical protein
MRVFTRARWAVGVVATLAAGLAAAATILVTFPEFNGPPHQADESFPQPSVTVGTSPIAIPAGEKVVSAAISGFWGTKDDPDSTAGVDLFLDGIRVAQCVAPSTGCWVGTTGQRPWSHTFTVSELVKLNDGSATFTAVQTSGLRIRLGETTLAVQTALPPPVGIAAPEVVPTLGPPGLLALLAVMAAAGVIALRRHPRG